ncbi:MAG: HTH domain-containing protein [Candidatus Woesearchaeota archaeon]|nr:HTH domain-containing protein [Candidatus Woesearchaeota archaeon]
MIRQQRITIVRIHQPPARNINDELQWFGSSLGLFGQRDKEKSCFRVFLELLKNAKRHRALTSDELAVRTNLSRGTVVFHLHKLAGTGLIIHTPGGYILRVANLEAVVEQLRKDINESCLELLNIAKEIDEELK